MIQFIKNYYNFHDNRGNFVGLVNFGAWREINLITSDKNSIRGGHYHKNTIETFIILDGEIDVKVYLHNYPDQYKVYFVKAGDVFMINPMVVHIFYVKTAAKWINLLSNKMDMDSPDIYKEQ